MSRRPESPGGGGAAVAAGAGVSAFAVLASACCVPILAPLVVSILGVSGAIWAAGLRPYALSALAAGGLLLAWGHWRVRSAQRKAVACPPQGRRWTSWVLWTASALWLVAAILNAIDRFAPGLLL